MKDDYPCYGCEDRTVSPNCHDTCYDRFIPWKERQEERKKKERDYKRAEGRYASFKADAANRNRRRRHKRG